MQDNKQSTSSIKDILNDVDTAVAVDRSAKVKKRKRIAFAVVVCVVAAALIGYGMNGYIQNRRFRDGALEAAVSVMSEYGVDDLSIVSVSYDYPNPVVFQSDAFADLPDKEKMEVFRKFDKMTGTYARSFDCSKEGNITVISAGKRYTAQINEYGSSHYRYLYADGDTIFEDTYTKPSSSSNSSSHSGKTKCSRCSGTGKVTQHFGNSWNQREGYRYGEKCGACGGTGYR